MAKRKIDSNCAMFRWHLMASMSAFAVGKSYFCWSGSDSLDKAAVHWKVCHAGSECLHTTQLFFLSLSCRALHNQTDGPHLP